MLGSIRGERCWRATEGGGLISPQQSWNWLDGENVSKCRGAREWKGSADELLELIRGGIGFPNKEVISVDFTNDYRHNGFFVNWVSHEQRRMKVVGLDDPDTFWTMKASDKYPDAVLELKYEIEYEPAVRGRDWITWDILWLLVGESPDHQFADCTCGFYAYLNGVNDYISAGRVIGVVEGYGETLIGRRGFRSNKARILALAPSPEKPKTSSGSGGNGGSGSMVVNGRMVNWSSLPTPPQGVGQAFVSMGAAASRATHGWTSVAASGGGGAGATTFGKPTSEPNWDEIRAMYPGVAIFDNHETMRLEFPATDLKEVLGDDSDIPDS